MSKKVDIFVQRDSNPKAETDVGVSDKDDHFEDQELTMNVEMGDDEFRCLVRLIKWYQWLKSEMYETETRKIANVLLDKDSVGEILLEERRRIAVDRLLKHVLRTKTTMRFFDLFKKTRKPSDELQKELEQLEPSEEDIKAYRLAKMHEVPQWKFEDDDRNDLWFAIKQPTTVDKLNDCFLSKFFYGARDHDEVFDKLLSPQTLGDGIDRLFETMNKCDKCIMRCCCDTLETYCGDFGKVVGQLNLREKYCESASKDKGDSTVLRFLTVPLRRLFQYLNRLCFAVEGVLHGSLVVYLSANTDSSWEKLKQKCKSGEIVELLDTLNTDDQIRKICFEEGVCVRITIHSVKGKSAWPKAILRIDSIAQDQSVGDGTETNLIKHNMDILCEELEICDSLIEEFKEQNLVRDDIRELLERQHTRASTIRCLMENICPPEKGFKVLQDYIKRCNTYLFEQLEISSEEYRNTEVFFTCEAQLAPDTAGSDLTRFKWVAAKGMRFYDAEQEGIRDKEASKETKRRIQQIVFDNTLQLSGSRPTLSKGGDESLNVFGGNVNMASFSVYSSSNSATSTTSDRSFPSSIPDSNQDVNIGGDRSLNVFGGNVKTKDGERCHIGPPAGPSVHNTRNPDICQAEGVDLPDSGAPVASASTSSGNLKETVDDTLSETNVNRTP